MRHLQRWTMVAAVVLFAACSKDKDIDKPADLTPINATLKVDHLWSAKVADKGGKVLRLGLGLAVEGDRVFAAGYKGEVTAYNINNGHEIWRTKVKKEPFSGGPAAGHDLVVVGTSGGDVIALGSADGKIRWRVSLNGEILAAPAISERVVAVRTVDGKLRALSPADGHELWTQEQQVPRLSLRGTSSPVIAGELTLCGFDNGKVVAVNMNDGSLQWEATIAPPHGKTELERLDDVDSTPHVSGQDVFTVGFQGKIAMLALDTGQVWWQHDASSYRDIALDDDAIYMATADGKIRWRVSLNGEILAAPAVSERVVAVRTVDGKLRALSPADGHELWTQEQQVPRLSLRGTSSPVIAGELTLCGFDNGKVVAVNMNDGSLQWEATIAPPHGKTELERLDDVDSTPHVSGQDVFTVGFQGKIAMLALDTGQVWWQHDASSYRDIALDDDAIYMATADGEVVALRRRTGAEVWRQKALLHRGLSAVALTDNAVVTADYKGNLHWLDKATGELAAREPTGKVRVSNAPVVSGNIVLVINDAGRISAYRTSPIGRAMAAPHSVPAETSTTGKTVVTPEAAPAAAPAPEPATPAAPAPEPAAPPTVTPQPQ